MELSQIQALAERVKSALNEQLNEANTKSSLINRKPICRLFNFQHFDWGMDNIGKNASILIFTDPKPKKFPLQFVDDIYPLADKLIQAVKFYE